MAMSEIKGVYLCPAAATPPGHWLGVRMVIIQEGRATQISNIHDDCTVGFSRCG